MNKSKITISVYAASVLLFLISILINFKLLELISKPLIFSSLLFYFFLRLKVKEYNYLFFLTILFFFLGEVFFMINDTALFEFSLVLFVIPYLIIVYFIGKDLIRLFENKNRKIDFTFIFILIILIVLLCTILNNLEVESLFESIVYVVFGVLLVIMGFLTSLVYYNQSNRKNFYLVLAVASFIISDLFFLLNKNFYELMLFKLINGTTQMLSYFFYIEYFLERSNRK